MEIILNNINYKGRHFDTVKITNNITDLSEVPMGKLDEMIVQGLDTIIEREELGV